MNWNFSLSIKRFGNYLLDNVLPVLLLAITCLVTILAGAYQANTIPLESPWDLLLKYPETMVNGFSYALTLLLILFAHRFGYYALARRYKIPVALPLFLPGSPNFVGGGAAFIRINSISIPRKALFDISASGTIMGFLVATISLIIGLYLSLIVPRENTFGLQLGESLLSKGLSWAIHGYIPKESDIALHPIGFAAWHGLFVINYFLIPYYRTDGGFLGWALWGRQHRKINWGVATIFIILGAMGWVGWFFMIIAMPLVGFLIGKPIPQVENPESPLGKVRTRIAWGMALIFILTFMPFPFYFE